MPRETVAAKRERAIEIARRMNERYPKAECALHYDGEPFRLVIAVLLSAQTTDKGVNKVTPALWKRYPTPAVGRRHRRRRDYPCHRLLSHEGRKLRKVRPTGGLRVRRRNPAGYRRAAKASWRGKENRERRAQRGIRNRRRHRGGHARLSDRAQAETRRPLGRHARENGNRPAQALPARLMGADQPSMGALRA